MPAPKNIKLPKYKWSIITRIEKQKLSPWRRIIALGKHTFYDLLSLKSKKIAANHPLSIYV